MKPENCAVFILAAGLSTRFGEPDKLMTNLGDRPMLSHVIDTVAPLALEARFGVVPQTSKRRRALLLQAGFQVIENPAPETGVGSSIILAGQRALEEGFEAICILLGDMPFIAPSHIDGLIEALYDEDSAASVCDETIMPPIALRRSLLPDIAAISPQAGAKALLKGENTAYIPLSNQAAQDIDDPETLAWLNAKMG